MKPRHFFAALLLAVGIGQQAFAQEPQKPEAQQEAQQVVTQEHKETAAISQEKAAEQPRAETTREVAPASIPASVPAVAKTESAVAAHGEPADSWIDSFLYEVKVTDVLIAFFAGMLVVLGSIQARRMREAVSAAKESVTVAERSAKVAEESARVAEDALISGQRAFMFIREIKTYLHQDSESGKYQWSIHPVWANSGNTPTKGLSINTSYQLLDEPLPKNFDFPHSREDLIPTIAGPKSMVEAVPGMLTSEDLEAVQKGRKFFYIWGWAEYHDIFEGTRKHITRFCNQLTQIEGDTSAPFSEHNPIQMMFGFHVENNFAD